MYDYNRLSTNRLARLLGEKYREMDRLEIHPGSSYPQKMRYITLTEETTTIKAVIAGRLGAIPLWTDK